MRPPHRSPHACGDPHDRRCLTKTHSLHCHVCGTQVQHVRNMFCSRYSGAVSVASTLSRATEAPERLNRDRVIDVAEEIVAARGVRGLNMRALAEAVGVGTTSLYRHVRAKEDVLGALANRKLAQLE